MDRLLLSAGQRTNSIEIFPNPSSEKVLVKGIASTMEYLVYDMDGKMVKKGTLNPLNDLEISVEGLDRGIHLIRFYNTNSKQYTSKRLILQ